MDPESQNPALLHVMNQALLPCDGLPYGRCPVASLILSALSSIEGGLPYNLEYQVRPQDVSPCLCIVINSAYWKHSISIFLQFGFHLKKFEIS